MALKYIDEIDLNGKKVIARFDFNVPLAKDGSGAITDTTRVDAALPTIKYILDHGATKLIMLSHLGRPKGERNMKFTLEPVAKYLAEVLEQDVILTESCTSADIKNHLQNPKVKLILLENCRFHKEEEGNDTNFAKTLASYADIYCLDAFGTAHRKHASTYEIMRYFPNKSVGGFLLRKEMQALSQIVTNPAHPFAAILGGAKVADKIKVIEELSTKADTLFIGGAMAYPFLKAQGKNVGKSLCSDEDVDLAKKILASPQASKITLPVDHVVSDSLEGSPEACPTADIPEGKIGLDIGPKTVELYQSKLQGAKTVLWNGPMGMFENKAFANGTFAIAKALAASSAFTVIGGGDSVKAVKKSGVADKISHISTGGGASLEFIENAGTLPGINALKFGVN
ncbi:MAG: phosphoglycerate kinase [Bacteriovoracaceae bacterium]|nr:phosphoglycerate kinase [Bacteriovoracaceae bacterium]